jgi:hypothetical protein
MQLRNFEKARLEKIKNKCFALTMFRFLNFQTEMRLG